MFPLPGPQLPGNSYMQYSDAAQGAGGAAMGAVMGKRKKKQAQPGAAQPGMPDLMRDLGAAGLGPAAAGGGQGGGFLGLHAPQGYGGYGGAGGLMSAFGNALGAAGYGQGGGFGGFGGGGYY